MAERKLLRRGDPDIVDIMPYNFRIKSIEVSGSSIDNDGQNSHARINFSKFELQLNSINYSWSPEVKIFNHIFDEGYNNGKDVEVNTTLSGLTSTVSNGVITLSASSAYADLLYSSDLGLDPVDYYKSKLESNLMDILSGMDNPHKEIVMTPRLLAEGGVDITKYLFNAHDTPTTVDDAAYSECIYEINEAVTPSDYITLEWRNFGTNNSEVLAKQDSSDTMYNYKSTDIGTWTHERIIIGRTESAPYTTSILDYIEKSFGSANSIERSYGNDRSGSNILVAIPLMIEVPISDTSVHSYAFTLSESGLPAGPYFILPNNNLVVLPYGGNEFTYNSYSGIKAYVTANTPTYLSSQVLNEAGTDSNGNPVFHYVRYAYTLVNWRIDNVQDNVDLSGDTVKSMIAYYAEYVREEMKRLNIGKTFEINYH